MCLCRKPEETLGQLQLPKSVNGVMAKARGKKNNIKEIENVDNCLQLKLLCLRQRQQTLCVGG